MKKLTLVFVALILTSLVVWLPTRAQGTDEAGVRACIEHYFRGHATGDGAHYRRAFHPDAKLFFMRDGQLTQWTLDEFVGRASGKPPADEAARKRRIESVDITGNAAIAKIVLDYPAVKFTDYMSLLNTGGEWKVVNKTFMAEPKQPSPKSGS